MELPPLKIMIWGGVVPGAVAFVLLGVIWLVKGKSRGAAVSVAAPIALMLAYVPAYLATYTHIGLWPKDTTYRSFHVAIALLAFVVLERFWRTRWWRHVVRLVAATGLLAVLLEAEVRLERWDTLELVYTSGLYALAAAVGAWLLEAADRRGSGWKPALVITGMLHASAFVLVAGSMASLGAMAGGLGAAAVSMTIVGAATKGFTVSRGAATFALPLMTWLLVGGRHYASASLPAVLIVLAAPLALHVDRLPWLRGRKAWVRLLVQFVALGAILGAAAFVAWDARPSYDYEY